jgi:spermidine/putrescine transport system ATP-binding protein
MADRIAVMKAGEIVQLGTGEEIYRRPNSRYVADFIGEANLLACSIDEAGELRLEPGGLRLPYRVSPSQAGSATLMVRPEDIDLLDGAEDGDTVALSAVVRDLVFVGNSIRIYARTEFDGELLIAAPSAEAVRLHPGKFTTAGWRRSSACILPS